MLADHISWGVVLLLNFYSVALVNLVCVSNGLTGGGSSSLYL